MSSTEWFVLYERIPWLTVLRPFFQYAILKGLVLKLLEYIHMQAHPMVAQKPHDIEGDNTKSYLI